MKCLGFARQSLLNHTSFPGGKKCTLQLKNHSGLDIDQEPINLFWEAFSLQLPWGRRGLPYYAIKKKKKASGSLQLSVALSTLGSTLGLRPSLG